MTAETNTPHVLVDLPRCEGHGLCVDAAPEVYGLDDKGEVVLVNETLPLQLVDKAERGARVCPVAALKVKR